MIIIAILAASVIWFIVAGTLFFNPVTDKVYRTEDKHPAVRSLPPTPKNIGKIYAAVLVQTALWAFVYTLVASALPGDKLTKGLLFGLILVFTKIIPRDADRLLLTTYPMKRMTIEFAIGAFSAFVVGIVFGYLL
jgi:hypothetical protein